MSHFTVLVIWDNPEKQLAPFQENNMDDCPKEYLKYCVYDKDWNKHRFDTEEDFKKSWIIPEDEDWGYRENPNAKWDWYQLWGRRGGIFSLKKDVEFDEKNMWDFSFLTPISEIEKLKRERKCSKARKWDIDFEWMYKSKLEREIWFYKPLFDAYNNQFPIVPQKWKDLVEQHKENIQNARDIYGAQEEVKEFNKKCKELNISFRDTLLEDFEWFTSVEEYVKSICPWFYTFAVIKDGVRYEEGKMGRRWAVSDRKSPKDRSSEFKKLLEELPEDTLLSVYDCHI